MSRGIAIARSAAAADRDRGRVGQRPTRTPSRRFVIRSAAAR